MEIEFICPIKLRTNRKIGFDHLTLTHYNCLKKRDFKSETQLADEALGVKSEIQREREAK